MPCYDPPDDISPPPSPGPLVRSPGMEDITIEGNPTPDENE